MGLFKKHGRSLGFKAVRDIVRRERMRHITVVETGTLRETKTRFRKGDGWSTVFFRELIDGVGGELHSVDIDPEAISTSRQVVEDVFGNLNNTHHHVGDSVEFLRSFSGAIDILYLDSYDYDPAEGDAAARHQLAEIQACVGKLSPRAVILVDDIYEDLTQGKPVLSIPFMKENGWTEIDLIPVKERNRADWYQALLRRPQHSRGALQH